MTTILVLGGTGLLGAPAVRHLLGDGFAVRVLARRADAAREALGPGVDVVEGDATDPAAVDRALAGCAGVHLSVSGPAEPVAAELVAAAAPGHGVERITYLSGATVSEANEWFPMVAQKLRAEAALRAGTTPWTVLCPTWPMEQLPRFVMGDRATVIGEQATPLHWYAAADLARMVARAFQVPEAAGRRLYVHGPEGLTMRQALERFCSAARPGVEVSVMPLEQARAAAEATGNDVLRFMADLMGYFDQAGEGSGDPAEANRLLGAPATTLDAWLAAYLDADRVGEQS